MNLGLYLADIRQTDGGVFQYSLYVLQMLINCEQIEQLTVFITKQQQEELDPHLKNEKISLVYCRQNKAKRLLEHISEFWITRYYMREKRRKSYLLLHKIFNPDRRFLNKFNLDLLHVPKQHAPVYRLKYPVIITMHDLQHLHYPEFFSPLQRIHKSISYFISIEEADRVIVSYEHVQNDIKKFFCTAADKVSVCAVPLGNDWIMKEATDTVMLKNKFDLPEMYILTPSSTWAHKNHLAVVEALNILKKEGIKVHWVATGNKTPFFRTIAERINELDLQDQINFTGHVSDQDLRGLYTSATLVVMPTKYEAGSGPLFEAIRYNTPVICSNVTSLPETIGDSEFVFDPDDYLQLSDKIRQALTDQDFIRRNKENARKQLDHFKEIEYAEAFLDSYGQTIKHYNEKQLINA